MKKISKYYFVFILLILFYGKHYGQKLSPYAEISVLTCDPGNELYSTFGHSAIRIKDPVLRIDNVYNYGTFNFNTPGFYLKFIKGQLDYMLSVAPYRYFILSYKKNKRAVKEQVLNLDEKQKNMMFGMLSLNAMPENRYYRYDFLKDNCSTRVLKIINEALNGKLKYPDKITDNEMTYRQMLMPYLEGKDWERFGINLALGRPVDKTVSVEEATFLPDYLYLFIEKSRIKTPSKNKPLVKKVNMLYAPAEKTNIKSLILTPNRVFWSLLIFILLITLYEIKYGKYFSALDKTFLFIYGLAGLSILFLWAGTEHSSVVNNQNIIWASPLFFIAAFMIKRNNGNLLNTFFLIYAILIFIGFITDLLFIPLFDKAAAPLELIAVLRLSLMYFRIKFTRRMPY